MPELGKKPLGGTLLDNETESKNYPRIYLMDSDVDAVPNDAEVGDERLITGKVRVSEMGKAADGSRNASLEVLELYLEDKDKPHPAEAAYPTMKE
jgi:hypothetical protein|tara:strand:+ start:223 stop:507 length:285 start_codon:yes stop_codon:yes gene_type:complete